MSKDIKAALELICNSLVDEYEKERQATDSWKKLFAKTDGLNFKGILREASHQMECVALDAFALIEEELKKVDSKASQQIFEAIYALPYLENRLTKYACDTEHSACSVDKAFYILNQYINDNAKGIKEE